MQSSDPGDTVRQGQGVRDDRARELADQARPLLGSEGFSDERIDELAYAFVDDMIGHGVEQFVNWAMAEGPIGLDPEEGL